LTILPSFGTKCSAVNIYNYVLTSDPAFHILSVDKHSESDMQSLSTFLEGYSLYCLLAWRNLENNALSSLLEMLRNRLVWGGGGVKQPPTHIRYSPAGSVTVDAKTTMQCFPDASIPIGNTMSTEQPSQIKHKLCISDSLCDTLILCNVHAFTSPWFSHTVRFIEKVRGPAMCLRKLPKLSGYGCEYS
jgi:hypothetical protein